MFWYNHDLERLENDIATLKYKPRLVFYGSSTFTLWDKLTSIFEVYRPINLGFGGSTLAACTWFFDRVFKNINTPDAIIIYAGDNDLGDNRHPEEVVLYLENLLSKIRTKYGEVKCTCISVKPSLARKHLLHSIHYTNSKIEELMATDKNFFFVDIYDALLDENGEPDPAYFEDDGLHLNPAGYEILLSSLEKHPEIFPKKALATTK